jgi:hypothetical protein
MNPNAALRCTGGFRVSNRDMGPPPLYTGGSNPVSVRAPRLSTRPPWLDLSHNTDVPDERSSPLGR